MNPVEIIDVIAIVLVIGGAVDYIIKEKKSGKKCIGCPYAKECGSKQGSGCNREHSKEEKR